MKIRLWSDASTRLIRSRGYWKIRTKTRGGRSYANCCFGMPRVDTICRSNGGGSGGGRGGGQRQRRAPIDWIHRYTSCIADVGGWGREATTKKRNDSYAIRTALAASCAPRSPRRVVSFEWRRAAHRVAARRPVVPEAAGHRRGRRRRRRRAVASRSPIKANKKCAHSQDAASLS